MPFLFNRSILDGGGETQPGSSLPSGSGGRPGGVLLVTSAGRGCKQALLPGAPRSEMQDSDTCPQASVDEGRCEVLKATLQADVGLSWQGPWRTFFYLPGH